MLHTYDGTNPHKNHHFSISIYRRLNGYYSNSFICKMILPCLRSEGSNVFQLKITLIHKFFHKRIFIKFYIKLWLCSGIKCISAIKFFVYVSSRVILLGFALLEWIWWIYKVLLESKIFYAAQSPFSRFFFSKLLKVFLQLGSVLPSVCTRQLGLFVNLSRLELT